MPSIESVLPSNHLIRCHPLLLLPSIFPCIRVFPNELALLIGWPKYWSFSFSISPSNEYSGLLVWSPCSPRDSQESSLHHSSKASSIQCSAFFISNSSRPFVYYMYLILNTHQYTNLIFKLYLHWSSTSHWSEWSSSVCLQIINAGEGVEKSELSYIVCEDADWYNHNGNQYGSSLKN